MNVAERLFMTTSKPAASVSDSAAKFDRIRRAHQSEVAEDYVEMISDLIEETGEARTVDLAARFGVTSPTVNAIVRRLQREVPHTPEVPRACPSGLG